MAEDRYSDATTDQLQSDVRRSRGDTQLADRITRAEATRLEQANALRTRFFWMSTALAYAAVLTSIALVVGVVFFGRSVSDAVSIAFISGLAVETIGILAVMGGYLFPSRSGPPVVPATQTSDER